MTDGTAEGVRNWLRNEGFPLELRAARTFSRHAALGVTPGDYFYASDDADRAQEIDLTVSRSVGLGDLLTVSVVAPVECKTLFGPKGEKRQAVAFRAMGTVPDFQIFRERHATRSGAQWLQKLWFTTQEMDLPLMRGRAPQAYGITTTWQSSGSGNKAAPRDIAYKAVESVATAANAITRGWEAHPNLSTVGFAIPLVVLSGDLFLAGLGADSDDVEVEQVDRVQLLWRNPVAGATVTVIDVVTEPALEQWADEFTRTATGLIETEGHSALAREAHDDTSGILY